MLATWQAKWNIYSWVSNLLNWKWEGETMPNIPHPSLKKTLTITTPVPLRILLATTGKETSVYKE